MTTEIAVAKLDSQMERGEREDKGRFESSLLWEIKSIAFFSRPQKENLLTINYLALVY